jgi:hypothetical protein
MFEQFSTPPTPDMYILLRIISLVFFLHNQIYDHTVFVIVLHVLVFIYFVDCLLFNSNVSVFLRDIYFCLCNNKVSLLHRYWRAVSINRCLFLYHEYFGVLEHTYFLYIVHDPRYMYV